MAELDAMKAIVEALEPLSMDDRVRAMAALICHQDLEIAREVIAEFQRKQALQTLARLGPGRRHG